MKKSKILTILMVLVLMFSLVACSTAKNNDKSQSNNTADISNLMESEPRDVYKRQEVNLPASLFESNKTFL